MNSVQGDFESAKKMDAFNQIYRLTKLRKYNRALTLLVDPQTGRLRAPFASDANHAWYVVGDILFKKDDYRGALPIFKKVLRTRPDDYQAMWAIADCYSLLKRPAFAQRYFRKAIELAPKKKTREELRYNLGNAQFDQQRFKEAIELYESIAKENRNLYKMAQKNLALAKRFIR